MLSPTDRADALQQAADRLLALGTGKIKPIEIEHGLCRDLWLLHEGVQELQSLVAATFTEAITHWPKYSGMHQYPVPHFELSAYNAWHNEDVPKWDDDDYGNDRRELAIFVAEYFDTH